MKLSALDWRNLSMLYQDLASAVLRYRISNSKTLSLEEKNSLNLAFGQLLNSSETFANEALSQALVDIDASVKNLQVVAHDAIEAVQSLAKLKAVLDIATSAVGLASALLAPTPGTIATALSGMVTAIQAAKTPATS
jgi:hypothetical protein